MSQLEISDLHYQYNGKAILNGLNLSIAKDEIVGLLGASGCGKTTTLKAIAGLLNISHGSIAINGKMVNSESVFLPPEQRNIGMMFQDYALFPHLTVADNIAFGLRKLKRTERQQIVDEMLSLIKMEDFGKRYPHQLSGGQQQRVAIARALAYSPQLLLLDEAFSNIDPKVRFELIDEIKHIIKARNVTAVFVTHSKEEAFALCDRMAVINNGIVEQIDTPARLFEHPKSRFVAEFFGKGTYLPAQVNDSGISCMLGDVSDLNGTDLSPGMHGDIFVRANNVKALPDTNGKATILARRYTSQGYEYEVDYASNRIWATSHASTPLTVGAKVNVTLLPHVINFFTR
ncbi:ABC transporter ATP-binding protein [Flocculibacter collagenilyticus]|uniref:ABC transporter ATP-binding protein n=1 Tax=Flocculibacter collagenilyticus TaxID=2744479 RepID=UPI0018F7565B|nr:ABC transporter ATP-binding protein [Flocculibacter collagenilyticus]